MERTPASKGKIGKLANCAVGEPDNVPGYDVLLWGDSHADHLMPGLASLTGPQKVEIRQATVSGCSPILGYIAYVPRLAPCVKSYQNALAEASRQADIDAVVVSSSWSAVLESLTERTAHGDPKLAEQQFTNGLRYIVRQIHSAIPNAQIVFVGSTPDYELSLPKCFGRAAKLGFGDHDCAERAPHDKVWGPKVDEIFKRFHDERAKVVLPRSLFCRGSVCETRKGGHILYYDDDHLSVDGSKMVAPLIMAQLQRS